MKSFNQYITELFDNPYKWSARMSVPKGFITPENPMKVGEFRFKTSDGGEIEVLANHWWMDSFQAGARGIKEGHSIIIEFIKTRKGDDHRSTYDMTGEGDAMRIMATVLDIIKSIIKKHEPMTILFSADKGGKKKGGRAGAYGAIVKRFAGKLGYKSDRDDKQTSVRWQLTKK